MVFQEIFQRLAGCGSVTGSNIAAIYALSREDFKDFISDKKIVRKQQTMNNI